MIILATAAGALILGVTIAMIILAGRQSHERPGYIDLTGQQLNRPTAPIAGSSRVRAESERDLGGDAA